MFDKGSGSRGIKTECTGDFSQKETSHSEIKESGRAAFQGAETKCFVYEETDLNESCNIDHFIINRQKRS